MRTHATALLRRTWSDRRKFALATAIVLLAMAMVIATPLLLLTTVVQRETIRREPLALSSFRVGVRALLWLTRELTGAPHGPWHLCAQCARPILDTSRAAYCSHACRTYARLERDAELNDPRMAERAQRRLNAIRQRRLADENPAWTEIPF